MQTIASLRILTPIWGEWWYGFLKCIDEMYSKVRDFWQIGGGEKKIYQNGRPVPI